MKIINIKKLDKFIKRHQTAKSDLEYWKIKVEKANWLSIKDIKSDFSQTRFDIPGKKQCVENRMVFKIGANWRIDAKVSFGNKVILIKRIGTHEDYNKWNYEC